MKYMYIYIESILPQLHLEVYWDQRSSHRSFASDQHVGSPPSLVHPLRLSLTGLLCGLCPHGPRQPPPEATAESHQKVGVRRLQIDKITLSLNSSQHVTMQNYMYYWKLHCCNCDIYEASTLLHLEIVSVSGNYSQKLSPE